MLVGSKRIAMVINKERWENRVVKHEVRNSPARRSTCVPIRLAKACELWVIDTYSHHAPDQHVDAVHSEWTWIHARIEEGRDRRALVVVAGDFNTYPDEELDRSGSATRSPSSRDMSRQFASWTASIGITSIFRSSHPALFRYTYSRSGTCSALDDIYVTGEHESAITASAVWLNSVMSSGHVGVAVAVLKC
ncbi:unnamed protein product [Phytophthora fragariaefolia]|uniref:Unnamed protein product n=1 Tax=Phytophthora fragariaefolia TaxID=1490495 RepID=A0A9W7D4Y9_9STRA|nr:unnamed protein product [Phytophthora fragariaefolia]